MATESADGVRPWLTLLGAPDDEIGSNAPPKPLRRVLQIDLSHAEIEALQRCSRKRQKIEINIENVPVSPRLSCIVFSQC